MSDFYCSSSPFISLQPFECPVIGSEHFISITPFPETNTQIPTLQNYFQNITVSQINQITDIYHPTDEELKNGNPQITNPILIQRTFIIFLEISKTTVEKGIVHKFVEDMRKIANKRVHVLLTIYCFGHSLKIPFMKKDFKSFTITSVTDLDEDFFLPNEYTYFDIGNMPDLFMKYLDEIDAMKPEICDISLGKLILHNYENIRVLRTPSFIISSDAQDATNDEIELIISKFSRPHMSLQFFLFGDNQRPNINKLIKSSNSHIYHYGYDQNLYLYSELLNYFAKPYVRFVCVYAVGSDSIKIKRCIGNFCTCVNDRYCFNKLKFGDTVHFFIEFDKEKAKKHPPALRFIIQYFDTTLKRYKRVIPVDLQVHNDPFYVRKTINPTAIVVAAATKLAIAHINNEKTNELLENMRICLNSDYFKDIWDEGTLERVRVAAKTIRYALTDNGSIEVLSKTPDDIFRLLSPLIVLSNNPTQYSVLYKDAFEYNVVCEVARNRLICFDNPNKEVLPKTLEMSRSLNPNALCEKVLYPVHKGNNHDVDVFLEILSFL